MSYYAYINGPVWKQRRASFLMRRGKKCEACGHTGIMEVHHRTYDRMGQERDSDLAVLCDPCHTVVHQLHKSMAFTSLDEATAIVIKNGVGIAKTPRRKRRRR